MVGGKKVLFMDEISTGLDSATTFLITKCLSNFCHIMDATLLVALLQPAPETYNLFDDVMLLSQGQIVFHGPREEVPSMLATVTSVCLSDSCCHVFLSVPHTVHVRLCPFVCLSDCLSLCPSVRP